MRYDIMPVIVEQIALIWRRRAGLSRVWGNEIMKEHNKTSAHHCGCGPLSEAQKHILHERGTEPPGSSPLNDEKRPGHYECAACGARLFNANTKYESGSGWPSFFHAEPGAVGERSDSSLGMQRVEIYCTGCHGHLGHVFPDGPQPTGLRYCTNGLALHFVSE